MSSGRESSNTKVEFVKSIGTTNVKIRGKKKISSMNHIEKSLTTFQDVFWQRCQFLWLEHHKTFKSTKFILRLANFFLFSIFEMSLF